MKWVWTVTGPEMNWDKGCPGHVTALGYGDHCLITAVREHKVTLPWLTPNNRASVIDIVKGVQEDDSQPGKMEQFSLRLAHTTGNGM